MSNVNAHFVTAFSGKTLKIIQVACQASFAEVFVAVPTLQEIDMIGVRAHILGFRLY